MRAIDANGTLMGFKLTFRRDAKNLHGFGKFVSADSACDPSPEALKLNNQAKRKKVQWRFPWAEEETHLFLTNLLNQTVFLKGYSYDRHLHVRIS